MANIGINSKLRHAVLPRSNGDRLCLAAFTIGLVWVFLPKGAAPNGFRFMEQAFNVGHMALFFLACHLVYVYRPQLAEKSSIVQALLLMSTAVLGGGAIEILQIFIPNRTPSFMDLAIDVSGVIAYLSFRHRKKIVRYVPLHLAALFLIGAILWPPIRSFTDESIANRQFPLLAGFETPLETGRFEAKASAFRITREKAFAGTHSLRLDLSKQHYSGIWLRYMPHDWRDFSSLEFAVYNSRKSRVDLRVRINDQQNWSDYYDEKFLLEAADWTRVKIPLAAIRKAPEKRHLDLGHIRRIGFYVVEASQPMTLYIDDIRLK